MTALSLKQRRRKKEDKSCQPLLLPAVTKSSTQVFHKSPEREGGKEGRLSLLLIQTPAAPSAPTLLAAHCCAAEPARVLDQALFVSA